MNVLKVFCLVALALVGLFTAHVRAQDFVGREEVAKLRAELVEEKHYTAEEFDAVFANVKRLDQVISLMDAPIRAPTPWHVYWPRHIGGDRFQRAQEFVVANKSALQRAEKAYGVPSEVITGIIGVETIFGRITGNIRVVDALATLGFDYPRRADFFRGELKEFLILCKEISRSPLEPRGSFAGAMGWPQFMPGSWRKWAVDFDGSGKVDLWNSREDIVGSVAAFLAGHGWQRDGAVMLPIATPNEEIQKMFSGGLTERKPFSWWKEQGIRITKQDADVTLPTDESLAGLISLDRADGTNEYWITFENFYVITRYNRSRMYASSVWSLAYWLKRSSPNLIGRSG
ncbi:MAG: lytic murein transglycosylase B [Casimicrobium sp.]